MLKLALVPFAVCLSFISHWASFPARQQLPIFVADVSRVAPVSPNAPVAANAQITFTGVALEKYGVESDFSQGSAIATAKADGLIPVGTVSASGLFRVRITDKDGANGRVWWALVTQPDPLKQVFSLKWTSASDSPTIAKETADASSGAWAKLWTALRKEKGVRDAAFKSAADKFLTENFLSAQSIVLSCAVAVHPVSQVGCAISVAKELVDFLSCFFTKAAEDLKQKQTLTQDEVDKIKATLKAIALAADSLSTAVDVLSLKKGAATALEVGTSLAALMGSLTEFTLGDKVAGKDTFQVSIKLTESANALAVKHSAILTILKKVK